MEPRQWYQVSYTVNGDDWKTFKDENGVVEFDSFHDAFVESCQMLKRRYAPAKESSVMRVTEVYLSDLKTRELFKTREYALLV